MGIVKVNRSGKQIPIYADTACSNKIGTLYPNELFVWVNEWNGSASTGYYLQWIRFKNSAGVPTGGWIPLSQSESGMDANICKFPQFTQVKNGTTYYAFKMRRDEELFDTSGNQIGIIETGRTIWCKSSTSGSKYPERLAVHYKDKSTNVGVMYEVVPGSYGFVDIGLDKGSTFTSNASLIGSL